MSEGGGSPGTGPEGTGSPGTGAESPRARTGSSEPQTRSPEDPRARGRMDFPVEELLDQPLVAHLATNGPTLRPIWFLWEEGAFWWLTGSWSHLPAKLIRDPRVRLVVDTCDLATGVVRQVRASGEAELRAYDADRAYRKLRRYLGDDPESWDRERFSLDAEEGDRFACLRPARIDAIDLSYRPAAL